MAMLRTAALVAIGLGGGAAVGLALIAFVTTLGVVTRLAILTRTSWAVRAYGWAVLLGGMAGSLLPQLAMGAGLPAVVELPLGLALGTFTGMIAASLTEVLDVMPVMGKRLELGPAVRFLVLALALGKMAGSLVYWLSAGFP